MDIGDVPSWITALASVAAVAAAVAAALYARNTWRHQVLEAVQKQAEMISGWVEKDHPDFSVILSNDSSQPVFDVVCTVHGVGREVEIRARNLVEAHRGIVPPGFRASVARLPIEQAERATRVPGVWYGQIDDRGVLPSDLLVDLTFMDSRGRRWRRRTDGTLEQRFTSRSRSIRG